MADQFNILDRASVYAGQRTPVVSGRYSGLANRTGTGAPANNDLNLFPVVFVTRCTIDRIGVETTGAGNAGAVVRLGLYADSSAYPASLVADYGTVAADAVAVPELTISQVFEAGVLYWIAAVTQNAATTAPTLRVTASSEQSMVTGASASAFSQNTMTTYRQSSVSGALPASFTTPATLGFIMPRVFWRYV